jgi:hypothetical protein
MTPEPADLAASAAPPEAAPGEPKFDPFDPLRWELPVVCKDCEKEFKVPYRHFQAGVVFHCPHCHGSYVPNLSMYRRVHDCFEAFYAWMRRERTKMAETGSVEAFNEKFEAELAAFHTALERVARELRPAGKMVRRKGLAAMFT